MDRPYRRTGSGFDLPTSAIRFHAGHLYSATAIISEGPCREGSSPHDHLLAQAQRRTTQALL